MQTTLLTENQILGDNALSVLKKYGALTALTDFAVVRGGCAGDYYHLTSEGDHTGYVWLAESAGTGVLILDTLARLDDTSPRERRIAARPVLPSSETSKIRPSAVRTVKLKNEKQVKICEYGEYPQDVVSGKLKEALEEAFEFEKYNKPSALQKTGKKYTFDKTDIDNRRQMFQKEECIEYMYNGHKYIRIEGNPGKSSIMSNGKEVQRIRPYWLEVKPIEWLMDEPSGIWVAKKALFAGIQFDNKNKYNGDFAQTDMKKYLDNYFSKEMLNSQELQESQEMQDSYETEDENEPKAAPSKKKRRYNIQVVEEPLTVKEQINFYVQNKMSFMLHGPSGVGKTARVEAIDENLTAVPLWNGVLPEDIVGKIIYPDGQTGLPDENKSGGVWVAPDWYNELCKKCKEEPDKMHVLFIDEVTNARPTTQSLIFHITLKKSISPSKGKLPDNAVVVLAGNSKEESGAAYNMPEPLFRRMCGHIHIKADIAEWLEWGSEKNNKYPEEAERLNIHPLVSSFVGTYGKKVFYSSYNEEEPKDWAIDPRGWEQISDIIYDNKGVIRRELLENKMGRELASSFLAYAKNPPLSLEEIINGEYSSYDIPRSHDARLALTMNLRHVDEKNVGKVRRFIEKNLGAENRAVFDSLWVGKNDERALQIAQMQSFIKGGRN